MWWSLVTLLLMTSQRCSGANLNEYEKEDEEMERIMQMAWRYQMFAEPQEPQQEYSQYTLLSAGQLQPQSNPILLYVRVPGQDSVVPIEPSIDGTIDDILVEVARVYGIQRDLFDVVYQGKKLDPSTLIADNGLSMKTTVTLSAKPKPTDCMLVTAALKVEQPEWKEISDPSDNSCCDYAGIRCDDGQPPKITDISFLGSWYQLLQFPDWQQLNELTSLQILSLRSQDILRNRAVPWSLLPRSLELLVLSDNQLQGEVEWSALPKELQMITLEKNQLSGNIDLAALAGHSYLKWLQLNDNRFSTASANLVDWPWPLMPENTPVYLDGNPSLKGTIKVPPGKKLRISADDTQLTVVDE